MADIIIRRCTLRVVRRGGWSWGSDPDRLLKAAVASLPLLIARRLGDLFADETDREITERLKINVPVKLSELLELGSQASSTYETISSPPATLLEKRLATAVGFALAATETRFEEVTKDVAQVDSTPVFAVAPREVNEPLSHPLLRVLLRWKRQGELGVHLASFNEEELEAWQATLIATVAKLANSRGAPWAQRISQLIALLAAHSKSAAADRLSLVRLSLIAFIEIGEQLSSKDIDEVALLRTCEELSAELSLPNQPAVDSTENEYQSRVENVQPLSSPSPVMGEVVAPAMAISIQPVTRTEFTLRSVLPFLLLGPLSKIGYFEALAATLEATGLSAQAPLFAAALAFKVLAPPARGWRRDDQDSTVAAAFAGLETPPAGDVLAEFARKLSGRLTALDSLVSYSLVKGHRPDSALLLHRAGGEDGEGLLLIEPDGLFPLCWARDVQSLLPMLRYFGETHLLVQQSSAEVETLQQLHQAGFRFITDAPPTRSENWRELRRTPQERWYSNDVKTKQARLVRLVEDLTTTAEQTGRLWRALKVDRPAIPTGRDTELERSITMAASLALGTISWVLWRSRETVTPLLALERFGTLSGKVRFTSSSVVIHLPLGQRYDDLHEHNLLADIKDLPWLDGRKVEFFGG